ncbi:type II toxin-antitoxin system HicB family antitoxin [Collinsella tanakaei]|uniref:type II toxin-antitoxin system HicB family antitoxin n=1 Tax=Collinsella tanakaei TaxID=626935 RepID=UPI0025A3E182|nr:type II toxin-antitoxin system HicB family antitoxin [Collinsella tanakaei]MDM8246376.1 type II toxin-antitoxin system HicB family antitoxin [Collinsella tanakaei]
MAKPNRYFYPAVFTYEPEQEIAVVFPDLDVATSGVDEQDALMSARELLGITMYGIEQDGLEPPVPTHVNEVDVAANERAVLVDVYMPSVRLASANRAVSRTVTLPAWLNAQAAERGFNFSQVLQEALKERLQA